MGTVLEVDAAGAGAGTDARKVFRPGGLGVDVRGVDVRAGGFGFVSTSGAGSGAGAEIFA